MRFRLFIVTSLILLSLLISQAFSQTPSQPISGYDEVSGSFITGGGSLSEEAQASRADQNGQPVKDTNTPAFPIGTHYFGDLNSQQTSRVKNQTVAIRPVVNVTSPYTNSSAGLMDVTGSWSLMLDDNTSRMVALTLFQNEDAVYGTGYMSQVTNTTLQTTASGSVTGNKLNLNLVSMVKLSLYRFSMTINKDSVTGSYTALTPGTSQITGTAKGERFLPHS